MDAAGGFIAADLAKEDEDAVRGAAFVPSGKKCERGEDQNSSDAGEDGNHKVVEHGGVGV
jgi:hypothetical protein